MPETVCSYCSENNFACGPKRTRADLVALQQPSWSGLNLSWEVIAAHYQTGRDLGIGSFARVIEVLRFPALTLF